MRKRLLSLALALVLCLGLTAPVAAAEVTAVKPLEEEYTRAFNYRVYSDGMLAVEKKDSAASGYIYLDRNGNELSGALFTEGMDFSEGLAAMATPTKPERSSLSPSSGMPDSSTTAWPGCRTMRRKSGGSSTKTAMW